RMCIDVPLEVMRDTPGGGRGAAEAFLRAECVPSVPEPLRGAMLRALAESPLEICPNHAIKTHHCAAPGVALVGDSGGCSHPITAAGMTVALNDIHTLATALSHADAVDDGLARYQTARYEFV